MLTARSSVRLDDPATILREIVEHYEEHGTVTLEERAGTIDTVYGRAELEATGKTIEARVSANDETSLGYMKLGIVHHLREFAGEVPLDITWTGHGEVGVLPPYFREMRVVSAQDVTPAMRRVVLRGPNLDRFARDGIHVRLLFPPKGRTPAWPLLGDDGCPRWPEGEDKLVTRVYTVRSLDPERGEMAVDILRHDGDATPGSAFAVGAQPGDIVGVIGPVGEGVPKARSMILLGDETAIPAIARILSAMDETATARAYIEVAGPQEEQPLPAGPNVSVEWVMRGETTLAEIAQRLTPDDLEPGTYLWAACEFADFKAIRRHCRAVLGLKRDRHSVTAYWRRGRSEDQRREDAKGEE